MADFEFLQNKLNGRWVISAPRRSHRTNVDKKASVCPFCVGHEVAEEEVYTVTDQAKWRVRVITNKFPFAPHHEIIIHSPDHHKNWDELPFSQVELVLQTYRQRYVTHKKEGQVYIFHNRGHEAGESLPHPHTQLVVIPHAVKLDITPLEPRIYELGIRNKELGNVILNDTEGSQKDSSAAPQNDRNRILETDHFYIFCPTTSEWPDEVWIAPKSNGGGFGFIKDAEITDLGFVLSRLVQIYDARHGHEFPFNFYIAPYKNWYLRLIPRKKIVGGFELGTNIIVNTQDPKETFAFIREHFWEPDHEKIRLEHRAEYQHKV